MKRTNYLINGVAAVAVMFLFAQCAGKTEDKTGGAASGGAVATTNMKIAYVEIDTLLTQYNFWNDLNEAMMKKEENIRATLNQKARELDGEAQEFQRKLQNNAFVSRERAEQEHARLTKKQQDLQELQNRLTNELAAENQKNSFNIIYLWHLKFSFASLKTTLLSITFKLIFLTFLNGQKFILIDSLESLVIEK